MQGSTKQTNDAFVKASTSGTMIEALNAVNRRMDALEKEVQTNMNQIASSVSQLGYSMVEMQRAMALQSAEISYSRNLSDLQAARVLAQTNVLLAEDPARRIQAQKAVALLLHQEEELRAKIQVGIQTIFKCYLSLGNLLVFVHVAIGQTLAVIYNFWSRSRYCYLAVFS